ncbi:hypothetical protein ACLOJK_012115 [Asimina triloba]
MNSVCKHTYVGTYYMIGGAVNGRQMRWAFMNFQFQSCTAQPSIASWISRHNAHCASISLRCEPIPTMASFLLEVATNNNVPRYPAK